jgi:hypothetical protein
MIHVYFTHGVTGMGSTHYYPYLSIQQVDLLSINIPRMYKKYLIPSLILDKNASTIHVLDTHCGLLPWWWSRPLLPISEGRINVVGPRRHDRGPSPLTRCRAVVLGKLGFGTVAWPTSFFPSDTNKQQFEDVGAQWSFLSFSLIRERKTDTTAMIHVLLVARVRCQQTAALTVALADVGLSCLLSVITYY